MIPSAVLMVRPRNFGYNPETAASNAFQQVVEIRDAAALATAEFDRMVEQLRSCGIEVWVFDDRADVICPDAVFPNNWLAMLPQGPIILFPMEAESRRGEVNPDLVNDLRSRLGERTVIDLTDRANKGQFLEGTGSIIFDHQQKWAYACASSRTDLGLLSELCEMIGYAPISFEATDASGRQVYHTNVVMSVGAQRVIVCLESIADAIERSMLKERVKSSGKEILEISFSQMKAFAGNAFEVQAGAKNCWVLSQTAWASLNQEQKAALESDGGVCAVEIPTIEQLGGGSARCMMAGVF